MRHPGGVRYAVVERDRMAAFAGSETVRDAVERGRRPAKEWGGYIWFMSLGTLLLLPIFLIGYVARLTFVGAPFVRTTFRFGRCWPTCRA
jgi:hypothetical protein